LNKSCSLFWSRVIWICLRSNIWTRGVRWLMLSLQSHFFFHCVKCITSRTVNMLQRCFHGVFKYLQKRHRVTKFW
jgi:hypothetical protein